MNRSRDIAIILVGGLVLASLAFSLAGSGSSEFEVPGLPAGYYRVRALDLFGHVTFASGTSIRPVATAAPSTRRWAKVDLDEPNSREVVGFERWESGLLAAKAPVVMQNSQSFRKFVKRVEADEHGFYHFVDVPGDEPYFVFAQPPGEETAMRNFDYFAIASSQREVWRDQTLHPHRVTGNLIRASAGSRLQLVRIGAKAEQVLWTFDAEPSGQFAIANVPHGRYRVRILSQDQGKTTPTLPFEVVEGKEEGVVHWPEVAP